MGLLDQLAGQLMGSLGSSNQNGQQTGGSPLLEIASSLIQSQGGIDGLLAKFQSAGLGAHADSWVGQGENMPINDSHVTSALGTDTLTDLAAKFGLSGGQVASGLATVLPQLINHMTPNGNTQGSDDLLGQGMAMLGGLLKQA